MTNEWSVVLATLGSSPLKCHASRLLRPTGLPLYRQSLLPESEKRTLISTGLGWGKGKLHTIHQWMAWLG